MTYTQGTADGWGEIRTREGLATPHAFQAETATPPRSDARSSTGAYGARHVAERATSGTRSYVSTYTPRTQRAANSAPADVICFTVDEHVHATLVVRALVDMYPAASFARTAVDRRLLALSLQFAAAAVHEFMARRACHCLERGMPRASRIAARAFWYDARDRRARLRQAVASFCLRNEITIDVDALAGGALREVARLVRPRGVS